MLIISIWKLGLTGWYTDLSALLLRIGEEGRTGLAVIDARGLAIRLHILLPILLPS